MVKLFSFNGKKKFEMSLQQYTVKMMMCRPTFCVMLLGNLAE